jgi:hypothetical protein
MGTNCLALRQFKNLMTGHTFKTAVINYNQNDQSNSRKEETNVKMMARNFNHSSASITFPAFFDKVDFDQY